MPSQSNGVSLSLSMSMTLILRGVAMPLISCVNGFATLDDSLRPSLHVSLWTALRGLQKFGLSLHLQANVFWCEGHRGCAPLGRQCHTCSALAGRCGRMGLVLWTCHCSTWRQAEGDTLSSTLSFVTCCRMGSCQDHWQSPMPVSNMDTLKSLCHWQCHSMTMSKIWLFCGQTGSA